MKTLEERIIKNVYKNETKSAIIYFISRGLVIFIFSLLAFISGQVIFEILQEEKTFDLLEIFNEDFEIIKKYLSEVFFIFFEETPKVALIIMILSITIVIILLMVITKNKKIIINKVRSLLKFWAKK